MYLFAQIFCLKNPKIGFILLDFLKVFLQNVPYLIKTITTTPKTQNHYVILSGYSGVMLFLVHSNLCMEPCLKDPNILCLSHWNDLGESVSVKWQ